MKDKLRLKKVWASYILEDWTTYKFSHWFYKDNLSQKKEIGEDMKEQKTYWWCNIFFIIILWLIWRFLVEVYNNIPNNIQSRQSLQWQMSDLQQSVEVMAEQCFNNNK